MHHLVMIFREFKSTQSYKYLDLRVIFLLQKLTVYITSEDHTSTYINYISDRDFLITYMYMQATYQANSIVLYPQRCSLRCHETC